MNPRRACLSLLVALALGGCSLVDKMKGGSSDAKPDAAAVAVADAAPPPAVKADNVNDVARFPDEVSLGNVEAKIADPQISARNAAPTGSLVATLHIGTPVTQIARHESFILCAFPDPKNPAHTLEGWVGEQAFVAGPAVPRKVGCPAGKTLLVVEGQDFCGKTCKADTDCGAGQACEGKANLVTNGKPGADISTCTVRAGDGGAAVAVPSGPRDAASE